MQTEVSSSITITDPVGKYLYRVHIHQPLERIFFSFSLKFCKLEIVETNTTTGWLNCKVEPIGSCVNFNACKFRKNKD